MDVGSGGVPGKVAVVQLCLESGRCDVMQIVHSGIPPSLATLLEDPSILKVAFLVLSFTLLRFAEPCALQPV